MRKETLSTSSGVKQAFKDTFRHVGDKQYIEKRKGRSEKIIFPYYFFLSCSASYQEGRVKKNKTVIRSIKSKLKVKSPKI